MICGTPAPVTMRVVQVEPGPTPTFTASAPRSTRSRVPSAVATLPAIRPTLREPRAQRLERRQRGLGVTVGDVHHERVDIFVDQRFRPLQVVPADADCRADAQPALVHLWSRGGASTGCGCHGS